MHVSDLLSPTCTVYHTVEPFTHKVPELTPTIRVTQGSVQVPVVRVDTSPVKKVSEMSSSDNTCILVSDPTEDVYEDLEVLFADCEPMDEDLVQPRISTVEPFKHVEGTRKLDIKCKKSVHGLEPQTLKNIHIVTEEKRHPGPDCLVIERPTQKARESEDYG